MTRQEKSELVLELTERLKNKPNIYLADTGGMSVERVNNLRRLCFSKGVEIKVVKNTLLRKAMEATGVDYSDVYPALKQQTAVLFAEGESINAPAKLLKDFRKGAETPTLKGAFVFESVFLGDDQLEALASMKSKKELIGDIIMLLQSPAKNVVSALTSAGGKLGGILKTLEERGDK
jgi:large subunit ribosomal protein L10